MANDSTFQGEFGGEPKMFPHPDWTPPPEGGVPKEKRWCGRCGQTFECTGTMDCSCPGCAEST